jgi:hypothetical protein
MKRTAIALAAVLTSACGGGSGDGTRNLANFEGAPWTGPLTGTVNCAGTTLVQQVQGSITLSAGSGADLQFSTLPGCTFKFNVSGNVATLANGPVSCTGTQQGIPFTTTVTSYTLSTADGHSMAVNSAATVVTAGQTCTATVTGTLSR